MRKKREQKTKVKMVIAGPGSGKTTGLVKEVLTHLPLLKPNRFIAVITYTNAATDKIREELQQSISIPYNLFIGTIHSFLNTFILSPYGALFEIIPSDVRYIEAITEKNKIKRNIIQKKIRDKGIITYEQIETISKTLICGGKLKVQRGEVEIKQDTARKIAKFLGKRLQAIFVDEYQDANTNEHAIFKRIIESGKADCFYCVGDPEQYIYGFSYSQKGVKKPSYEAIPIKEIDKTIEVAKEENQHNYRATQNLVTFLNQFSPVQQKSQSSVAGEKVFFIQDTNLEKILSKFREKCSQHNPIINDKYYLSYSLKHSNINWFHNIKVIDNGTYRTIRVLSEVIRYISSVIDKSLKSIRETRGLQEIELRKVGIKVLKKIRDNPNVSQHDINNLISESLSINLTNGIDSSFSFEKFKTVFSRHIENTNDYCATIHKCKGLEADAVIVVAETSKKLQRWFEIDIVKRASDSNDECRLGYVAFSRAKKLLCIACLEDIGELKSKLNELQLEII